MRTSLLGVLGALGALGLAAARRRARRRGSRLGGPSSFDPDHGFGAHFTLDYDFEYHHAGIFREKIVPGAQPGDPTALGRDLVYSSSRHT